MACNSCHKHGGGSFDEFLLKHNSNFEGHGEFHGDPYQDNEKSPMKKYLMMGAIVLGAIIIAKKLK